VETWFFGSDSLAAIELGGDVLIRRLHFTRDVCDV